MLGALTAPERVKYNHDLNHREWVADEARSEYAPPKLGKDGGGFKGPPEKSGWKLKATVQASRKIDLRHFTKPLWSHAARRVKRSVLI